MSKQKEKALKILVGERKKRPSGVEVNRKELYVMLNAAVNVTKLLLEREKCSNEHKEAMQKLEIERAEIEKEHEVRIKKIRKLSEAYETSVKVQPEKAVELFKVFCENLTKQ